MTVHENVSSQAGLASFQQCEKCRIPGAPAHEPSRLCHYRRHGHIVKHCTCSACY